MKTLIISNYFPPEIGAASNRIFLMAKSLKSEFEKVEVASPFPNYPTGKIFSNYSGFYKKEKVEDIVCHRLYIYPDNSSSPIKRLLSMLSFALSIWILFFKGISKNIDQIIVQNQPLLVSFSSILLFKKILNKKIILNVSDLWPQSAVDLGAIQKNSITHKIFLWIEKFNYKNSDKIIGQSKYILEHVSQFTDIPTFHYRNIPKKKYDTIVIEKYSKISFIYAGLLGAAQGILSLIYVLDKLPNNFVFHIYGDGKEKKEIISFLKKRKQKNIKYLGSISKNELCDKLSKYHYSFVPLKTDIKGAFPSKIYELVTYNIPVIYIGKGEAKKFIDEKKIGYSLIPENLSTLPDLIKKIMLNKSSDYNTLVNNCQTVTKNELNFNKQFSYFVNFIK